MVRRRLPMLAVAAAATAAACDVPTDAPLIEQEWQVTLDSIRLGIDDFLPAGIAFNQDSTRFLADYPGTVASASLAQMCGAPCAGFTGGTVPVKPAFRDTLDADFALATDLVSARVAGGAVSVELTHTLEFDPLSPDGATATGYIVVRATSRGAVVAEDSLDGADVRFTSADTLRPMLDLRDVAIGGQVHVEVLIYSPAGGPTRVGADDGLQARVEPGTVPFSSATVAMGSRSFGPYTERTELDVDSTVVDHVESGALLLDVDNPLVVTGTMDVEFRLPTRTIRKSVPLQEGSYRARVEFTTTELRSLLASPGMDVVASGTATSATGTVTLEPGDRLRVAIQLEAILLLGDHTEAN